MRWLGGLDPPKAPTLAPAWSTSRFSIRRRAPSFVHPVRTAIYEDLSAAEQADLHARAAGCWPISAPTRARSRCICWRRSPAATATVVTMLREAARSALVGGAPDTAATLLRRALDEPPDAHRSTVGVVRLGNAEHEIGDAAALVHLREAGETATDR